MANDLLNLEMKITPKNYPVTSGGFHTPRNSKICFFCLIYDLNITIFLLDSIYAKHINTPKKSKIKLLYITF